MSKRLLFGFAAATALVGGAAFLAGVRLGIRPENQKPGKFPEELVFARTTDDVVNGGVLFTTQTQSPKPLAVIWVHGWGTNFYSPTYVGIGRALAGHGYTTMSVNTRMHDIGNVAKRSFSGKRVRGGGYWGITSEDARDIAAWINFAEQLGYNRVVLVGHSAGWASVGRYQADSADERVAGLVFASGAVGFSAQADDPELRVHAKKLVDEGRGEDLLRLPNRSFPSFISAATHLDIIDTRREYKDFFGTETPSPAVMRVTCPLLAFYGTEGDVGGEETLELLRSSVQRLSKGPRKVDTTMIANANHLYEGEEAQVARTIAQWLETVVLSQ